MSLFPVIVIFGLSFPPIFFEVDVKTLTRNIFRTAITVILVILAFVAIFRAWVYYTASPWTRDARFSADIVAIAPDVSGLITQVNVKDNQLVKKDQVLFVIDPGQQRLTNGGASAGKSDGNPRSGEARS